jgi:hypothetical protein
VAGLALLQFGLVLLLLVTGLAILVESLLEPDGPGLGILVLRMGVATAAFLGLFALLGRVVAFVALPFQSLHLLVLVVRERLDGFLGLVDVDLDDFRALIGACRQGQADEQAREGAEREEYGSGSPLLTSKMIDATTDKIVQKIPGCNQDLHHLAWQFLHFFNSGLSFCFL